MNTADLAQLINVSLRQWQIDACCEQVDTVIDTVIDPERLAVTATMPAGEKIFIQRVHDGSARLPVWRFAIGARRPVEAVSLRQILKAMRMELDDQFVPGRTIIGPRPSVDAASKEPAQS
jgi:hypothetical protein